MALQLEHVVVLALYLGYYVVGTGLYLLRRNLEPIKSRGLLIPVLQTFAATVHFTSLAIEAALPGELSCLLPYWSTGLLVLFWVYPYFLRSFTLWTSFFANLHKLKRSRSNWSFDGSIKVDFLSRFRWVAKWNNQLIVGGLILTAGVIVLLLIFFVADYPTLDFDRPMTVCPNRFTLFSTILASVGIIFMFVFIVLLWNVQDSLHIKTEFRAFLLVAFPLFVVWAILFLGKFVDKVIPYFIILFIMAYSYTLAIVFPLIVSFVWERKGRGITSSPDITSHQVDSFEMIEKGEATFDLLDIVLDQPDLKRSFEKYCAQSLCVEGVLFYCVVRQFKKNFTPETAQDEANLISKEFLRVGSVYEANIDDFARIELIERIDEGKLSRDMFEGVEIQTHNMLKFGVFRLWSASASCREALKKLKLTDLKDLLPTSSPAAKSNE